MISDRLPSRHEIANAVRRTGFFARAARLHGKREETLPVDLLGRRRVMPRDFGFIAGTAVHVNVGLEHCSQLSIFELKKGVGASGHFEAARITARTSFHLPTRADLKNDTADMVDALLALGARRDRLAAFAIFGVGSAYNADVSRVLRVLKNAGLPVIGALACRDGDDQYSTHLSTGLVTISPSTTMRSRRVFQASPEMPDLAGRLLDLFTEAEAYRQELCGRHGSREFKEQLLPRLAALEFNRPERFIARAKRAVENGTELRTAEIGPYFTAYAQPLT